MQTPLIVNKNLFISSSAALVSDAVSGPAPPTWCESGTAHPSVTLATPGHSRERLWLVTWTAQGSSRDFCRCYIHVRCLTVIFLLCIVGLFQKNRFVRDRSDDMSAEGYYYPFFWLVFINKICTCTHIVCIAYCHTCIAVNIIGLQYADLGFIMLACVAQTQRFPVRYPVRPHTFVSPSADSRRVVVSYWPKYVHEALRSKPALEKCG